MAPSNYATTVDDYLLDCRRRGLRPATIRYYAQVLERVGRACDLDDPADLSLARVRGFQDEPGRLSPRSVRGSLVALKTFSRWLADEDVLTADPLARLRLPRVDQGVVTAPTDRELLALLWAAGPLLRTVLALLLGTGVRISDLTDLAVDDLRPGELVVARTKNRAGRLLPLDPVLEALLARHVADRGPAAHDALFVTRTGRPLTPDATRLVLADARDRVGLDVRVTPHIVRHWHARDLAAHGTQERLLGARMGWRVSGLIARYAPVAQREVEADVSRYAPLVRLRDEGALEGMFPRAVIRAGAENSSKNESARFGATTARVGDWRQS